MEQSIEISSLPWFETVGEQKIFKQLGHSCVYAVGPKDGSPVKIGWAAQLAERLAPAENWHWKPLFIHGVLWVQGYLGRRMEDEVHRMLDKTNLRLRGDWFNIPSHMVKHVFAVAADKIGLRTASHEQMIREVKRLYDHKIDRQVEAAGCLDGTLFFGY